MKSSKLLILFLVLVEKTIASSFNPVKEIIEDPNCVIVRLWCNTYDYPGEVGHASIETKQHYVSLWPSIKSQIVYKGRVIESLAGLVNSYREDLGNEGKYPSHAFIIKTLNINAINQAFEKLKRSFYDNERLIWRIDAKGEIKEGNIYHNCSTVVRYLLQKGEINERIYLPVQNLPEAQQDQEPENIGLAYGLSLLKDILPLYLAHKEAEKTAANVIMVLTGKKVRNSYPTGTLILRTYFSTDLDFYTPHQFRAVLTFACLREYLKTLPNQNNISDTNIRQILTNIRNVSKDILPQFDPQGKVIMYFKRTPEHQAEINSNRKFDKIFWSYFSLKSWCRWSSDEDLEESPLTPYEMLQLMQRREREGH